MARKPKRKKVEDVQTIAIAKGGYAVEYDDGEFMVKTWMRGDGWLESVAVPILFVHGFGQSAATWDSIAVELAVDHPIGFVELTGHGLSKTDNDDFYDLKAQAATLLEILKTFNATAPRVLNETLDVNMPKIDGTRWKKPLVVAYSLGGRVVLEAMKLGNGFSKVASGVILESANLGPASEAERKIAEATDSIHARLLRTIPLSAFFTYWESLPLFESQRALPGAVRQQIRKERLANDPEALALTFERAGQHVMPLRSDCTNRIKALVKAGLPVVYVAGALDGKYAAMAGTLTITNGVRIEVVPKAGHNVHLEAPEAMMAIIEDTVALIRAR